MAGCFSQFQGLLVVSISRDGWLFFLFQGMAGCFSHFKGWLVFFLISRDGWLFFSFQGMLGRFSHFKGWLDHEDPILNCHEHRVNISAE
jgi:hypothetical protein